MHFTSILTVALAALASAQSPVGYVPAVSQSLNVRYGNVTIKPNQTLSQAGMFMHHRSDSKKGTKRQH
jgi:hypothetical protein